MKALRLLMIAMVLATMSVGCGHGGYAKKVGEVKSQAGQPSSSHDATREKPWIEGNENLG